MIDDDLSPADIAVLERVATAFPATSARFDAPLARQRARQRSRRRVVLAAAVTIAVIAGFVGVVRRNDSVPGGLATVPSTTISLEGAGFTPLEARSGERFGPDTIVLEAFGSLWVTGANGTIYRYRDGDRTKAPEEIPIFIPIVALEAYAGRLWVAIQQPDAPFGSLGWIDPDAPSDGRPQLQSQQWSSRERLDFRPRAMASSTRHLYVAIANGVVSFDPLDWSMDALLPDVVDRIEVAGSRLFGWSSADGITTQIDADRSTSAWSAPGRLLGAGATTLWIERDGAVESWQVPAGPDAPRLVGSVPIDGPATLAAGANDRAWIFDQSSIKAVDAAGTTLASGPALASEQRALATVASDGGVWFSAPTGGRYEPAVSARRLVTSAAPKTPDRGISYAPSDTAAGGFRTVDLGRGAGRIEQLIATAAGVFARAGNTPQMDRLYASTDGDRWQPLGDLLPAAADSTFGLPPLRAAGTELVLLTAQAPAFSPVAPFAPKPSTATVWSAPSIGGPWRARATFRSFLASSVAARGSTVVVPAADGDDRAGVLVVDLSRDAAPTFVPLDLPSPGMNPRLQLWSSDRAFYLRMWNEQSGLEPDMTAYVSGDGLTWRRIGMPESMRDGFVGLALPVRIEPDRVTFAARVPGGLRLATATTTESSSAPRDITCTGYELIPTRVAFSGSRIVVLADDLRPPLHQSLNATWIESRDGGATWTCRPWPDELGRQIRNGEASLGSIEIAPDGRAILGGALDGRPTIWLVD